MYIERVPNRNSPPAVLLRESWRENGNVKKRTVANLSGLPDEIIEALRAAFKGESIPASEGIASPEKAISIQDARQHGHVAAIYSVLKISGLSGMIASKRSRERDVVEAMIIDRIINGNSKLAIVRHCNPERASTSLGELLSLEDLHENECYAAMDWLLDRQSKIQKKLAKKHLLDGEPVLFDLSSSYFEGQCCELAKFGYSRDHRADRKQVNYGIYCNTDGTPVGVAVLAGNESDRIAFLIAVERVRKDFNHKNDTFSYERNKEKIKAESALDGLYVIRSSVNKTRMSDQELVANYKNLERVERAFRSLKSIDLNVRPIYHRLDTRVRAHIFICMLAYHIEHLMRCQLAPLLFVDEQKETVVERDSVVTLVKRSVSARKKDQTHRTPDEQYPISSFPDILQTLSAITRSRVKVKGHKKGDFKTTSIPTPYQRKILELLGISRGL